MNTILVPTPEVRSPARAALEMEGLQPIEVWCVEPNQYGEYLSLSWNAGSPFVVCEWDIIPWPGAVEALFECPEPWCTHRYPLHRGNLTRGFGFNKLTPQGPAPEEWAETRWQQLDGMVIPVLRELFGDSHLHEPPVAHARPELK